MIDGILIFLLALILYSFWWFDFYFFKKNILDFENNFNKVESKNDVVIIFNAGGWGTINYKNALDLKPFAINIKKYLEEKGLKVSIIQYYRTQDHLIGKLGYLKDYVFAFPKQSKKISNILKKTNKKIILLGLSNGALLCDEIMERLKGNMNVFSIEVGKPFFGICSNNKNILLINGFEDDLSNGNALELLKAAFIYAPIRWLKNFIFGEGISLGSAFKVNGHNYSFDNYRDKVFKFINKRVL